MGPQSTLPGWNFRLVKPFKYRVPRVQWLRSGTLEWLGAGLYFLILKYCRLSSNRSLFLMFWHYHRFDKITRENFKFFLKFLKIKFQKCEYFTLNKNKKLCSQGQATARLRGKLICIDSCCHFSSNHRQLWTSSLCHGVL